MDILDVGRPDWVLLENVDALEESNHADAMNQLHAMLGSRGYDVKTFLLDCSDYALPQSRRRLYIFAVARPTRSFDIGSYDQLFETMERLLDAFKMKCVDLMSVLLPEDDAYVREEQARWTARGKGKGWESSTIDAHRAEWRKISTRWQSVQARGDDVSSPWYAPLTAAQKDTLAYYQHTLKDSHDRIGYDIGQSIGRLHCTRIASNNVLVAPCIVPKCLMWLSSEANTPHCRADGEAVHRPLLGIEGLMLQGYPIRKEGLLRKLPQDCSDGELMNLAGNAFPGTCVIALLVAFLFAAEGKDCAKFQRRSAHEEANSALKLLKDAT